MAQLERLIKQAKKNWRLDQSSYAQKFLEDMKKKGNASNLSTKQYFYLTHLAEGNNPHHYQGNR